MTLHVVNHKRLVSNDTGNTTSGRGDDSENETKQTPIKTDKQPGVGVMLYFELPLLAP